MGIDTAVWQCGRFLPSPFLSSPLSTLSFFPHRLQMLRESKHNEPGMEWMERKEAMRENLPPHFTDEQLQQRLREVGFTWGGGEVGRWS